MAIKLLLHGWTLAESTVIGLLPQHSGFLAVHRAARRLPLTGENDASNQRRAVVTVRDRCGGYNVRRARSWLGCGGATLRMTGWLDGRM